MRTWFTIFREAEEHQRMTEHFKDEPGRPMDPNGIEYELAILRSVYDSMSSLPSHEARERVMQYVRGRIMQDAMAVKIDRLEDRVRQAGLEDKEYSARLHNPSVRQ